ncbi:unnamed protein product [Allacma fusca]|uniref:RING-type domain-containing protein n=1 Tax=Allacma fusca TaxID=39272 RepID=A0A8J2P0L7_9HEXA|nr:unnamed protein product [Allacma fusca]
MTTHGASSGLVPVPVIALVILQLVCTCSSTQGSISVISRETNMVVRKLPCELSPEFGYNDNFRITGGLVVSSPLNSCEIVAPPPLAEDTDSWILLTSLSDCDFKTKITNARLSGYEAVIIYNESSNSSHTVPVKTDDYDSYFSCFTEHYNGVLLRNNFTYQHGYIVELSDDDIEVNWWIIFIMALIVAICLMVFVLCFRLAWYFSVICWTRLTALRDDFRRFARERRRSRRNKLFAAALKEVSPQKWNSNQLSESCAICVEEFHTDDELRILNCSHGFHISCIDEWLINGRRDCPVCKRKVVLENHELFSNTDSDTDDETAPLLSNSHSTNSQYGNVSSQTSQRRENPFMRGNSLQIQQENPDEELGNSDA